MRTKIFLLFILFATTTLPATKIFSQCLSSPPPVPCSGSDPLVVTDETINSGTTKWFYGSAATFNSLTLKGGKLIVCGDLTVDKFYMDSGQIIINWGARFEIGGGIGAGLQLKGNCSIHNYGILECRRNITLESLSSTPATPNIIANAGTSSRFYMGNQYFVITDPNSWFINKGRAQFWGIITDNLSSPNSVCLGPESVTTMSVLINKVTNTYRVPDGNACVYVHQYSQFYGTLTASGGLLACLGSSHSSDAGCIPWGCTPNAWGAAQVFTGCSSCAALGVLSVRFISFAVSGNNSGNTLKWEVDKGTAGLDFDIERSADGKEFYTIGTFAANSSQLYSYVDANPLNGNNYYRIRCKQTESNDFILSKTVHYAFRPQQGMRVYPSSFTQSFYIRLPKGETPETLSLYDLAGRNIPVTFCKKDNDWQVSATTRLSNQWYVIKVVTKAGVYSERVMHE